MQREHAIAVLGDHGAVLGDLAERVRSLGHRTVRVKTLEEAIDFAYERNVEYAAAFIEPMGLAYDLAEALYSLRVQANSPEMCFIATGPSKLPAASTASPALLATRVGTTPIPA